MQRKLIDGEEIELSGEKFIVPPCNFSGMEKYLAKAEQLEGATYAQQVDLLSDMILIALSRNYPELTKERLKDLLDSEGCNKAIAAIVRVSGLKKSQMEMIQSP
jgi:hypothetical protein